MLKDDSALRAEDGPTHPPRPATKAQPALPRTYAVVRAEMAAEHVKLREIKKRLSELNRERLRVRFVRSVEQLDPVRQDYESGMALRDIERRHRMNAGTLRMYAKAYGWERTRPPPGQPRRLSPALARAIKAIYETDRSPLTKIAKRFGIASTATLYDYAEREGWVRPIDAYRKHLPDMPPETKALYKKLNRIVGRTTALREVGVL